MRSFSQTVSFNSVTNGHAHTNCKNSTFLGPQCKVQAPPNLPWWHNPWKFYKHCARGMPVQGIIFQNFVKFPVLGVHIPTPAPMRIKSGMEESKPNFTTHRCGVSPLQGEERKNHPRHSIPQLVLCTMLEAMTMFMMLVSWLMSHCKSSPGPFGEHR